MQAGEGLSPLKRLLQMRLPCLRSLVRSQTCVQTDLNENKRMRSNTCFSTSCDASRNFLCQSAVTKMAVSKHWSVTLDQQAWTPFQAQTRHCRWW